MTIHFEKLTSPEIGEAAERNTLLLLPVGQVEEHGPHLPLNTDCIIATETAQAVAHAVKEEIPTLVLPTVWTAYTVRQAARWPGLISFREPESMIQMIYDILRSLVENDFRKIVIINAHGNNPAILELACRKIGSDYDTFPAVTFTLGMSKTLGPQVRRSKIGGCGEHAGEVETALLLHLTPELVHMDRANNEDIVPYHSRFFPGDIYADTPNKVSGIHWSTWGIVSPKHGVLGDPTVATAQTGKRLFEEIVNNHIAFVREYYAHEQP